MVGDRWTFVVIRDLFIGKKSFKDFIGSPENISTNILTSRLKFLENLDYISHIKDKNDNKIKLYYLKDRGVDLFSIMYELTSWSLNSTGEKFDKISSLQQFYYKKRKSMSREEYILYRQNTYKQLRQEIFLKNDVAHK